MIARLLVPVILAGVGTVFTLLAQPMFSGQEELTRWDTMDISNKTAMVFMVVLSAGIMGGYLAGRQRKLWGKILVFSLTTVLAVLLVVLMQDSTPLGLR